MGSVSTIEIIINASSGASDKEEARLRLTEIFKTAGIDARITLAQSGAEIIELARHAVGGNSQRIVAGGGDGTISAVASMLVGTDKALGVLPLGTFNYFARNLGVPLDLEGAARNIIEGRVASVDVGEVNGKIFLNNASLGLYPTILRQREKVYEQWGRSRLVAYFSVARVLLRPASFLQLRLSADGEELRRRTPLVFVGNNGYQLEEFNMRGRSCLDAGELAFYITQPIGRLGLLRLAVRGLFRRLQDAEDFQVLCLKEAWVETRRKQLRVAMDGEISLMKTPLHFRSQLGALRVIVPAVTETRAANESESDG